jgi:predicted phosphodiesterase
MANKDYKKNKKESFFTKLVNLFFTLMLACAIGTGFCNAANNNLRFAQISDVHFSSYEDNTSYKLLKNSTELLDDVVTQINTSGAYDFVMFTGDLINTPKVSELEKFIKHADKIMYPWYAIDGNHDISIDGDLSKSKFVSLLTKSKSSMSDKNIYYAFTPKKGYRVICLDSIIDNKITTNGEISQQQLDWLQNELNKYKKETIIICTHVPVFEPFSSSSHKLKNEYELKRLITSHTNPVIVLQGHYHAARLLQDDNVLYISCPSLVTFPNAFRVINVNTTKNKVKVDVYLKETSLKDIQTRAKVRLMGSELLYGTESDRNANFELRRED